MDSTRDTLRRIERIISAKLILSNAEAPGLFAARNIIDGEIWRLDEEERISKMIKEEIARQLELRD